MKNFVVFVILLIFVFQGSAFADTNADNFVGKWAERISERVIMDICPDKRVDEYNIFITWREDNLAQKDFYKFVAKLDDNGKLKYKKGIHFYRFYNSDGTFEEKPDYNDGTGTIKIDNNILIWFDNKDNTESEFIKLNEKSVIQDRYNRKKDYFDYSVVLTEYPKNYYYTTVKINKSKERILIISNEADANKNSYYGLFYYFAKNGFVYPLGLIESKTPLAQSKNYLYYNDGIKDVRFYFTNKKLSIIKSKTTNADKNRENIKFVTIESSEKFAGDYGESAGDDVVRATVDGFYFNYHKPQYKRKYIKNLMRECVNDGVKTHVQMYCCMVNKLHNKEK